MSEPADADLDAVSVLAPQADSISAPDAAFYFDLGSPVAYLAAERVLHVLPAPAEWQPVLARELSPSAASFAPRCENEGEVLRENIARRAHELGLQPLVWPEEFPFDSEQAMLVATYAKSIGRTVPFAQAAFRQAFAGGRSLAQTDNVVVAAAACEMHPRAVLKGAAMASTATELRRATVAAAHAGVTDVPALRVGERVWIGERAVEDAAAHMAATAATTTSAATTASATTATSAAAATAAAAARATATPR
jgi:2-hydroxychromene-2-carboxylate isomerase